MIQECNLHWKYKDGDIVLPWYTLPTLQWLKQQDVSKWIVFEYGAGYSTVWWRLNCLGVKSVDHDPVWAKAMGASDFKKNKEEYIQSIEFYVLPIGVHFDPHFVVEKRNSNLFDCIVIDGEYRDECVEFSRDCLTNGGYMIIDNYGQTDFPSTEVIDTLLEGWEKQVFKQPNHTDWCTAVFRKP